jgi:hypothetical protein
MKSKLTILPLVLLLLMAAPLLLSVILQVRQQYVQHEMKERLEKEKRHTLTLGAHDLQWVKKGKEIRIGNRLFDIHNMQMVNGKWQVSGLYDDEETAIENQLRQMGKQRQTVAAPFFAFTGSLPQWQPALIPCHALPPVHHAVYINHYHSCLPARHTPPPQA